MKLQHAFWEQQGYDDNVVVIVDVVCKEICFPTCILVAD